MGLLVALLLVAAPKDATVRELATGTLELEAKTVEAYLRAPPPKRSSVVLADQDGFLGVARVKARGAHGKTTLSFEALRREKADGARVLLLVIDGDPLTLSALVVTGGFGEPAFDDDFELRLFGDRRAIIAPVRGEACAPPADHPRCEATCTTLTLRQPPRRDRVVLSTVGLTCPD